MEQQLEILELRIAQMIERMKGLRSERARLQIQMADQEKACLRLKEERRLVRSRVEKIVETLGRVEQKGVRGNGE